VTIINQMIRQAKDGAKELLLPDNHIGTVAQHMCDTMNFGVPLRLQRDEAEKMLRRGTVKMYGVKVRVVPKQPTT
jgi:hypothetical protein